MGVADDSPYTPPLPAEAGPYERVLHEVYGFATPLVESTATDWGKTSENVALLATAVREVITTLQTADEPWEGPAATSAYATLDTLAKALDARAAEIDDIRKGLKDAASAADTAQSAYVSRVRSVSLTVDREDYQPSGGGNFNITGYEAAIESRREEREQAARQVLQEFDAGMTTAAKKLPVESTDDTVTVDSTPGGPGYPGGGGGGGRGPSGGPYAPPEGTGLTPVRNPTNPNPGPGPGPISIGCPGPVELPPTDPTWPPTGVDLDGDTTGTTSPTTGGNPGWAGTNPGGTTGGPSAGPGPGALGMGSVLGGAALLGKGILGKAGAFGLGAGRPGPLVAGSTGTAARGGPGTGARGATGAGAGRSVLAPGQQGQAARGGRGAVGAAGGGGRGRSGGAVGGSSAAGRRGGAVGAAGGGGRGRSEKDEAVDVDKLTNEDTEVWFEGEEDSSPPVWR